MNLAESKKSASEILRELEEQQRLKHAAAVQLFDNIKRNADMLKSTLEWFIRDEPDLVYRFYHQSHKVFMMQGLIKSATALFEKLAPDSAELNSWYMAITQRALSTNFDDDTNANWLREALPLTQAFWHSKYFLEQMISAADHLDEAPPQILPSGWAAVLYLYNLR